MKRFFDMLRLWLRNYFKHPVENIRQAKPIVPGRLYSNYGNICKAVPYNSEEKKLMEVDREYENAIQKGFGCSLSPEGLLELVRSVGGDKETVDRLRSAIEEENVPAKCMLCDFHKRIPCPYFNELADGRCVCDEYKYVIIKSARKNVY